jgi:hypothetical protein
MHMAVGVLTGAREQFASMGRAASVYETSLHLADCLTRIGRPAEALALLAEDHGASREDVSILDPARARFKAGALLALGRPDEAAAELAAGISIARDRRLEFELSLLLALTQELPIPVPTGSDETPLVESERLLTRLGVVDGPLVIQARLGAVLSPASVDSVG